MNTIMTLTPRLVSSLKGATGKKGPKKPKKGKGGWLKNRARKTPAKKTSEPARTADAAQQVPVHMTPPPQLARAADVLRAVEAGKARAHMGPPSVKVILTEQGVVFQQPRDDGKPGVPFVSQALEQYPKALEMQFAAFLRPETNSWGFYNGPAAKTQGGTLDDLKATAHEHFQRAYASTVLGKQLILQGEFDKALKSFEGVMDDLALFQPGLRYQAIVLMQLIAELRRAKGELSSSNMARINNLLASHRLVIESFFMALEEYAERSYLGSGVHERFERSLQAMVVWSGHARIYLKNEIMNLAGEEDENRKRIGRLLRRALEFQYGAIDFADPSVMNTDDRTRDIVVGDLFGFFGPVFDHNYDAFMRWTIAGSQSMRELAWTISLRMLFWNSAEDLDAVSDACPTDAALLQRLQGALTRAHGIEAAHRATSRLAGMLEEAEDMAREVAQRAEKVDHQSKYSEQIGELYAWADELRASRLVPDTSRPDAPKAEPIYGALKDRLPPDAAERSIVARLAKAEEKHRVLADSLQSAREALTRVLKPGESDDPILLVKHAVSNLVQARRKKKGIGSSMERRQLREDLEAAQRFAEQLRLDVDMAPRGLVAERIQRRASIVLPSLAEALLTFPNYRSDEIRRVFSRRSDGEPESERVFPVAMLPGNGLLPSRDALMRFLRQRGLEDTPAAYKVWNYWLGKALFRNDDARATTRPEFGAHDLPASIASLPSITGLSLLRQAACFAVGADPDAVPCMPSSHEVLYDTIRCGIAMGLDPVEVWELGYAMPIAHVDDDRATVADAIDRLVDRLRFEDDFTIYPQLANIAGNRKDGLQRAIFLARAGQSFEAAGQGADAAQAYVTAARLMDSAYAPAPDIYAALVQRVGQLQTALTVSAGNVLSTVGSGMLPRR